MSETPIALLAPPDRLLLPRGRPIPTAARPLATPADDDGDPVVFGVAAVDGSGRVRERAVLTTLRWNRGERLDIRVVRDIAVLRAAPHGRLRIDAREQIALPAGCRATLGIRPGDRVVLAALPASGIVLVCPIALAARWIRALTAELPEIFDA